MPSREQSWAAREIPGILVVIQNLDLMGKTLRRNFEQVSLYQHDILPDGRLDGTWDNPERSVELNAARKLMEHAAVGLRNFCQCSKILWRMSIWSMQPLLRPKLILLSRVCAHLDGPKRFSPTWTKAFTTTSNRMMCYLPHTILSPFLTMVIKPRWFNQMDIFRWRKSIGLEHNVAEWPPEVMSCKFLPWFNPYSGSFWTLEGGSH